MKGACKRAMDNWIEVNVAVTHEAVEAVAEILTEAGSKGVAIEDPQLINDLRNSGTWELCDIPEQQNTEIVTVSGYYADDEKLDGRLARIEAELQAVEQRIGKYRFGNTRFRKVSEQDWANEWKQYFHVTHVGKSLVIKPSWEDYAAKNGEHVIEIDPGMALFLKVWSEDWRCPHPWELVKNAEPYLRPAQSKLAF